MIDRDLVIQHKFIKIQAEAKRLSLADPHNPYAINAEVAIVKGLPRITGFKIEKDCDGSTLQLWSDGEVLFQVVQN